MKVFHISKEDLGSNVIFEPRIPSTVVYGEDLKTPRICVSLNLFGAILAAPDIPTNKEGKVCEKIHVYYTEISKEEIYQPSEVQVPDVLKTGELWLTNRTVFSKFGTYDVFRHMHYKGTPYSRFLFTKEGYDAEVDLASGDILYGDYRSFSVLLLDPLYKPEKENIIFSDQF